MILGILATSCKSYEADFRDSDHSLPNDHIRNLRLDTKVVAFSLLFYIRVLIWQGPRCCRKLSAICQQKWRLVDSLDWPQMHKLSKYVWYAIGTKWLSGPFVRVLPAWSWEMPVERELPAKLGRCWRKPPGHNFDFRAKVKIVTAQLFCNTA